MKHILILPLVISFLACSLSCAQTKVSQKERFEASYSKSKALVETRQFQFVGSFVYNNKTREPLDAQSNAIVFNKDTSSGTMMALQFEKKSYNLNGRITNYKVDYDDNSQNIAIECTISSKSGTYQVFIDVKPNGNAFLAARLDNNNSISWTGQLKPL